MQTSESQGKPKTRRASGTKAIWSQANPRVEKPVDHSFSEVANEVAQTSLKSQCRTSSPKCVEVRIEGVPVAGMIDTGSDITIISGELFKTIIDTAQLRGEALLIDKPVHTMGN